MRNLKMYAFLLVLLTFSRGRAASAQPHTARSATLAKASLESNSKKVARALWLGDTRTIAKYVHPQQGIRFSPYVYLDVKRTRLWSRAEIERARSDTRRYLWDDDDATGAPKRLTWNQFRRQYLSPRDFSRGAQITFQSHRSHGNTINNLREVYPDAAAVEFYVPGTAKYGGMDWQGLWLVWRPIQGKWYLAAVAGDRWTP